VLAGGCGGGGASTSGSGGGGGAEASRVVEGLPPHTGLQLRASFLFVDAWRGEPPPYSPLQTRANPCKPSQPFPALPRPVQP